MLHVRARQEGTSISELVRQAVRARYVHTRVGRKQAMGALVGLWKNRKDLADSESYVRKLRKGNRLKRIVS